MKAFRYMVWCILLLFEIGLGLSVKTLWDEVTELKSQLTTKVEAETFYYELDVYTAVIQAVLEDMQGEW